jgi:hypothetical protein
MDTYLVILKETNYPHYVNIVTSQILIEDKDKMCKSKMEEF